jgi:predicted DNA-binding transcriptional regulator AlpA
MSTTFESMPHHLVGSAEIAGMFGVSRQYVDRLSREAGFPEPEVTLVSGRIWSREAIETWAKATGRTVDSPTSGLSPPL